MGQTVPTLVFITRPAGSQGGFFNLSLFGTGFAGPLTIDSAAGVSFSNVVVASSTRIDAKLTVSAGAATGDYNITVTTPDGTSNALVFSVIPPPFITSITPNSGARGEVVTLTVSGGNFVTSATVSIFPTITSGSISVQSRTSDTIIVKFTVSGGTSLGTYNVQVSSGGLLTNTLPFSVGLPPAPTLTGISATSGIQADFVASVTFTGTNFYFPTLNGGNGISFYNVVVNSSTSITADIVIFNTAPLGDHNISVTNSGGTSNALIFTVMPHAAPTLTSISPPYGVQGIYRTFTLSGTNLAATATLNGGTGISAGTEAVTVLSPTSATALFSIASNAPTGPRDLTITSPGGTSNPVTFTIIAPPTLTSVSPSMTERGNSVNVTLTGTNFMPDLVVSMPFGVTVSNLVVNSSTSATATFTATVNASVGWRSIQIQEGGWSPTTNVQFAVTGTAPVLSGMNPGVVQPGMSGIIVLTGTDFLPLNSISAGCPYFNFNALSANNTTVSGSYSIPINATPGNCPLAVNALSGTSNSLDFTIAAAAPPPSLVSITPRGDFASGRIYPGPIFRIGLHGSGFSNPLTIDAGSGILVSEVQINDPTSLSATFNLGDHVAPGRHNVTVTTLSGTSNSIGFALYPPTKRDFNDDDETDLLWYNPTTGQTAIWLMNNITASSSALVLPGGTGWSPKQLADFDGDGKSDILWQHNDGSTSIWLMNGLSVKNSAIVLGGDTGWSVKQVADFDGDGKSDILWQHNDGSTNIWLMNGLSVKNNAGVLEGGTGWSAKQIGDFDGDGKSDILWQHNDGSVFVWLMDGLNLKNGALLLGSGTGWSVNSIADFDGDGKSDILWQHNDGSVFVWLMDGLILKNGALILGSGTGWNVKTTGDFDGDLSSDILWQHSDGSVAIWLMDGLNVKSSAGILGSGTGWSVNQTAEFDTDGKNDILWQHSDGSVALWLMDGLIVHYTSLLSGPATGWSPVP